MPKNRGKSDFRCRVIKTDFRFLFYTLKNYNKESTFLTKIKYKFTVYILKVSFVKLVTNIIDPN